MGHARSCRLSRPRGHRRRAGAVTLGSGQFANHSGRPILMLDERLAFLRTVAAIGGRPHLAGQRLAKAQREAAKLRKARDVFVGRQIGRSAETAWWWRQSTANPSQAGKIPCNKEFIRKRRRNRGPPPKKRAPCQGLAFTFPCATEQGRKSSFQGFGYSD